MTQLWGHCTGANETKRGELTDAGTSTTYIIKAISFSRYSNVHTGCRKRIVKENCYVDLVTERKRKTEKDMEREYNFLND